jgi:hypothetical protein
MTWWERFKRTAIREAGAVKDEIERAAKSADEALAKKERELNATPAERVDMLLEDIEDADARFDDIADRVGADGGARARAAGIEPPRAATESTPEWNDILAKLTVTALDAEVSGDRMSHLVDFAEAQGGWDGVAVDDVVAELQMEVMVLDAERRDRSIALRAPTLTDGEVGTMVARVVAVLPDATDPDNVQDSTP